MFSLSVCQAGKLLVNHFLVLHVISCLTLYLSSFHFQVTVYLYDVLYVVLLIVIMITSVETTRLASRTFSINNYEKVPLNFPLTLK